jgi:HAD superfamily hydrolase (TIGR01509 family)
MARAERGSPRAVLWDLDGTLADSSDFHWKAWQEAFKVEGREITRAQFLASFGQRNDTILSEWLGPDPDPERIRRVGEAKEAHYRTLVRTEGIAPLPGAAQWVAALQQAGWQQAIASSAPRLNVEVVHRALGFSGLIDVLVGAEDVQRGKPDPEVFLAAASRVGVPPGRCVVVEDAEAGIEAALRAGMKSIGVGTGAVTSAHRVVRFLTELEPGAFEQLVEEAG